MTTSINVPAPVCGFTELTLSGREITASKSGKYLGAINADEITSIRLSDVASPYHTHYTLEFSDGSQRLAVEYRAYRRAYDVCGSFKDAIYEIVGLVASNRPDFKVHIGNKLWVSLALTALYATVAIVMLGIGIMLFNENGMRDQSYGAILMGGTSLLFAICSSPIVGSNNKSAAEIVEQLNDDGRVSDLF